MGFFQRFSIYFGFQHLSRKEKTNFYLWVGISYAYLVEFLSWNGLKKDACHRGVHLISHKRLSWLLDVLLKDSREGSGLSAIESSQGSHPFYSLFIKALLFQLSYDTVPWYRMSGGLFVSSRFLPLRVWSFDNCCLMVICYIINNYETIACF